MMQWMTPQGLLTRKSSCLVAGHRTVPSGKHVAEGMGAPWRCAQVLKSR